MTSVVRPLLLRSLERFRCTIFQTSWNPTSQRTGAKYLKRRLRGPSMMKYYPDNITPSKALKMVNRKLDKLGDPGERWQMVDEAEVIRMMDVEDKKKRGKGTPKKAKTKADSRRTQRRR